MSAGHRIQSDTNTVISQAPSPLSGSVRKGIDASLVHHCGAEDAAAVLRQMHAGKQYLVRKSGSGHSVRWYKVASRHPSSGSISDEMYEETMLMSMMSHSPDQFVTVRNTVDRFHQIRTPPPMSIQGGGFSLFLHPTDMPDQSVKRTIQKHFSQNQRSAALRQMKHVLLRESADQDGTQWVDAFYTNQAKGGKMEIFTKSMPFVKAAARFMNVVVIPTISKIRGGGGSPVTSDESDSVKDQNGNLIDKASNKIRQVRETQTGTASEDAGDDMMMNTEDGTALGSEEGGSNLKNNFQRHLGGMSGDQAFTLGSELLQKERNKMVAAQGDIDRTEQGIIDVRNERIITDGTNAELVAELKSDQVRLDVQKEAMHEELRHLEESYAKQKQHLETSIRQNEEEKKSVHNSYKSNTERYKQHQKFLGDREKQLLSENSSAVERKMQALAGVTAAQGAAEHALGKEAASEQAKARYFQQEFDTRAAEAELTGPPTGFAATPGTTEPIYTPAGEYYLATPAEPGSAEAGLGNVDSAGGEKYDTLEAYRNRKNERSQRLRDINEGKQFSSLAQNEEGPVDEANNEANDGQGSDSDEQSSNSSISSMSLQEFDPLDWN